MTQSLACRRNTTPSTLSLWVLALSLPLPAMAEFRPLDDGALSGVTGQAGVTIELETKLSIDRFSWIDEGSLNVNGLRLSGQNDTVLDNMKLTIDIAGDGGAGARVFGDRAACRCGVVGPNRSGCG
ncbi:MAG: DUF6160 family protein [Marinobacter salsuginis]